VKDAAMRKKNEKWEEERKRSILCTMKSSLFNRMVEVGGIVDEGHELMGKMQLVSK